MTLHRADLIFVNSCEQHTYFIANPIDCLVTGVASNPVSETSRVTRPRNQAMQLIANDWI